MPKPYNVDLIIKWKITLPAALAGRVEYMLLDAIHQKPIYAARRRLIEALLENWVARESGAQDADLPHIPSVQELRNVA